jgi:lactose/L-arabinose transport system ATP-binding protein
MGVRLSNIAKSFGSFAAIRDVSMEIPTGSFAVFVGPSGCGKSTLLRMIAGLEETSGGHIAIDERDVTASSRRIAALPWSSRIMRFTRI